MMQDILELLIQAEARRSTRELSVEFKFDKLGDPIVATLEQFREVVERTHRVVESRFVLPSSEMLWSIRRALTVHLAGTANARADDFPLVTRIPRTGHVQLDEQLTRIAQLVTDFRVLCRRYGETRTQVVAAARAMNTRSAQPLVDQACGARHAAPAGLWSGAGVGGLERPRFAARRRGHANGRRCGARSRQRPHAVPPGELGRQANRMAIAPGVGRPVHRQLQAGTARAGAGL